MQVKVEMFSFNTAPGYVMSVHWQSVALLPAHIVAEVTGRMETEDELFDVANSARDNGGCLIEGDDLSDLRVFERPHNAGDYTVKEGILEVPNGFAAVEFEREAFCTSDSSSYYARVVGGESLKAHYEAMAARYAEKAAALS